MYPFEGTEASWRREWILSLYYEIILKRGLVSDEEQRQLCFSSSTKFKKSFNANNPHDFILPHLKSGIKFKIPSFELSVVFIFKVKLPSCFHNFDAIHKCKSKIMWLQFLFCVIKYASKFEIIRMRLFYQLLWCHLTFS